MLFDSKAQQSSSWAKVKASMNDALEDAAAMIEQWIEDKQLEGASTVESRSMAVWDAPGHTLQLPTGSKSFAEFQIEDFFVDSGVSCTWMRVASKTYKEHHYEFHICDLPLCELSWAKDATGLVIAEMDAVQNEGGHPTAKKPAAAPAVAKKPAAAKSPAKPKSPAKSPAKSPIKRRPAGAKPPNPDLVR